MKTPILLSHPLPDSARRNEGYGKTLIYENGMDRWVTERKLKKHRFNTLRKTVAYPIQLQTSNQLWPSVYSTV